MSKAEFGESPDEGEAMRPTIRNIYRKAAIAGQFTVTATVEYPDEPTRHLTFTGSTTGGPVLQTECVETFVTDPSRFGEFGAEWVRRFIERS